MLAGDGGYEYEIVGESHYQDALEQIAGRSDESAEHICVALLQADRGNVHDENAVKVAISGMTVGYIPRSDAPLLRQMVEASGALRCRAMIVGGWDRGVRGKGHFGVHLDMLWPPGLD
jgi:hypothetical protein